MSVLVDASVWIRYLSNRSPFGAQLDSLLNRDDVLAHDFVYGELLIGDKGGRRQLLASYALIDHAPMVPHAEVVAFVRARKLHGRGVSWIDTHLLASALVADVTLWTADAALASVARELNIAHDPDKRA